METDAQQLEKHVDVVVRQAEVVLVRQDVHLEDQSVEHVVYF